MTTEVKFTSELTVELIEFGGDDLRLVEAARVSTRGAMPADSTPEARTLQPADEGLIRRLMKDRHGSPFEQGWLQVRVHGPIFCFREWHRHRIGHSYNEESGRYTQLAPLFYETPAHRPLIQVGKPMDYKFEPAPMELQLERRDRQRASCRLAYATYEKDLEAGIAKEAARMCLPVSIYSSMYDSMNPRSIMSFLGLRTNHPEARFPSNPQWEIARLADQLEAIFAQLWPVTHKAFEANGRVAP